MPDTAPGAATRETGTRSGGSGGERAREPGEQAGRRHRDREPEADAMQEPEKRERERAP
jgi:hypothetical protein